MADEEQLTPESVAKLKVADLKRELKSRGLNPNGNKGELVDRLLIAMHAKADDGSADSVDELIDEDEVLNDEEIEEEDGDFKNIELEVSDKSFDLDNTNTTVKTAGKRKSEELSRSESVDSVTKPKKITLNRHIANDVEESVTTPTESIKEVNGKDDEKKVIKFSELTAKERMEMRAKKFGAPLTQETKKQMRAERFNQQTSVVTAGKKTTITVNNTGSDVERLKKRAERFGSVVSTQLSNIEKQEKLEQRKLRFGSSPLNGSTNETQKAKRLERFKTT